MRASRLAAAVIAVLVAGCASLSIDHQAEISEGVWQGLNAADLGQTITIAREPSRYTEGGYLTTDIIGRHPSERSVTAFFAATSLVHLGVTTWLAREADATGRPGWRYALYAWQALSIANSAYAVAHNANVGVPLFGPRDRRSDGYFPFCDTVAQGTPCAERPGGH